MYNLCMIIYLNYFLLSVQFSDPLSYIHFLN